MSVAIAMTAFLALGVILGVEGVFVLFPALVVRSSLL